MKLRLPNRAQFDYQVARDNQQWADHRLRVRITAQMIAWLEADSVIDPACGDGSIISDAHFLRPFKRLSLSDVSSPSIEAMNARGMLVRGSVRTVEESFTRDDTIFDVAVLTEFLEHVEDPVAILKLARRRARYLVASSPLWEKEVPMDDNPEHLWMFDAKGYGAMLEEAGWEPEVMVPLYFTSEYDFMIWVAK